MFSADFHVKIDFYPNYLLLITNIKLNINCYKHLINFKNHKFSTVKIISK